MNIKYITRIAALLSILFIASCKEDDGLEYLNFATQDYNFYVNKSSLSFNYSGGTEFVTIEYQNVSIDNVTGDADWLTVEKSVENSGEMVLAVTASNNEDFDAKRYTEIELHATIGDEPYISTIQVVQAENEPRIEASESSLSFDYQAQHKSVTIESNVDWAAAATVSWIALNKEGNKLNISVSKNTSAPRSGKICFRRNGYTPIYATISVSQDASLQWKYNGHAYVDLGLSVKWATCNVGASSPEEYGNYYAWGETTTKSSYTEDNSKTDGVSMSSSIAGDASYDAARANWGGTWRLPTASESQELIDNCTWTWTTQGGKNGYKVTSEKNGNSIFLPAAGCRYSMTLYYGGGERLLLE